MRAPPRRQAGVLVAAQGRVQHVVGEDTGLLGLVPDPAHGPLGQRAGLGDAQVDTFGGLGRILAPESGTLPASVFAGMVTQRITHGRSR